MFRQMSEISPDNFGVGSIIEGPDKATRWLVVQDRHGYVGLIDATLFIMSDNIEENSICVGDPAHLTESEVARLLAMYTDISFDQHYFSAMGVKGTK